MTARLMIINGPNLNYLGIREPHIYGHTTLKVLESECRKFADQLGVELAFHQSNFEGAIVELIQSGRESADALIINPAGYSFTSIAIIDARDELHRHSILSGTATSVICGLGLYGYIVAMQAALQTLGKLPDKLPSCLRPQFN